MYKTWANLIENPGESSSPMSGTIRSHNLAWDRPLEKHATKLALHYQSVKKEKKSYTSCANHGLQKVDLFLIPESTPRVIVNHAALRSYFVWHKLNCKDDTTKNIQTNGHDN
jgi:hypothetical protein